MNKERQSRLEILAYKIWEEQGRPEGLQEAHWAEAERRLRFDSDDRSTLQKSDNPMSGNLPLEGKTQDTPGRSNPSSSRQQTQPRQSTNTGSPVLDSKSAPSKGNRQRTSEGNSRPSDSKPDR